MLGNSTAFPPSQPYHGLLTASGVAAAVSVFQNTPWDSFLQFFNGSLTLAQTSQAASSLLKYNADPDPSPFAV
jgi:hypothetical protein